MAAKRGVLSKAKETVARAAVPVASRMVETAARVASRVLPEGVTEAVRKASPRGKGVTQTVREVATAAMEGAREQVLGAARQAASAAERMGTRTRAGGGTEAARGGLGTPERAQRPRKGTSVHERMGLEHPLSEEVERHARQKAPGARQARAPGRATAGQKAAPRAEPAPRRATQKRSPIAKANAGEGFKVKRGQKHRHH